MMRALMLASAVSILGSQASAFSLVGTWDCGPVHQTNYQVGGQMTFKANGRSQHTITAFGNAYGDALHLTLTVWGKWTVAGMTLDEKITRHKLQSVRINGQRINAGPEWDELAAGLADSLSNSDDDKVQLRPISDTKFDYIDDTFNMPCVKRGADQSS